MSLRLATLVGALVTVGFIVDLLRRRQMREKYAAMWLVLGAGVLVLGVFPSVLDTIADWLGVADPPNLLFFGAGLVLLLVNVQQSLELSRLEEETRTLAEELALLRDEVANPTGALPGRTGNDTP